MNVAPVAPLYPYGFFLNSNQEATIIRVFPEPVSVYIHASFFCFLVSDFVLKQPQNLELFIYFIQNYIHLIVSNKISNFFLCDFTYSSLDIVDQVTIQSDGGFLVWKHSWEKADKRKQKTLIWYYFDKTFLQC